MGVNDEAEILNALNILGCSLLVTPEVKRAALVIAGVFGHIEKFNDLMGSESPERQAAEKQIINGFQDNLGLLVEKTWVEHSDVATKAQVGYQLAAFCTRMNAGRYFDSRRDFMEILKDSVYLMFGAQSRTPEFSEYARRIDPDFGVFWRYIQTLIHRSTTPLFYQESEELCRVLLLLGMFFLENY